MAQKKKSPRSPEQKAATAAKREQRRDQGQAGRDDGAERDQQDDHRGEDPDDRGGPGLGRLDLLDRRSTELDLESRGASGLRRVDHTIDRSRRQRTPS